MKKVMFLLIISNCCYRLNCKMLIRFSGVFLGAGEPPHICIDKINVCIGLLSCFSWEGGGKERSWVAGWRDEVGRWHWSTHSAAGSWWLRATGWRNVGSCLGNHSPPAKAMVGSKVWLEVWTGMGNTQKKKGWRGFIEVSFFLTT